MSLVATKLQSIRVNDPNFDKNMARPLEYGALDFFIDQTNAANGIITPDLRDRAFASMGNDVEVPVINYDGEVTVSNSRSCTIADDENESALYKLVWTTYAAGFTMVPTAYMNNEISYDRDFARKLEKISRAMATKLDEAAIAALEANKTQVFKDTLDYTNTGNSLQVTWEQRNDILGDLTPIMRANAYPNQLHIVGNTGIYSLMLKLAQLGEYNEVNKRLEFADKIMHYTANLANEEEKFGTLYAVEDGNVAVLTRVDRESLRAGRANGHEWDVVTLPFLGDLRVGSHYYTDVGDQSSIAGAATADLTCAVKEYFGFSVDVAFLIAYNNSLTTVANPIVKAEIAKSTAGVGA